MAKSKSMFRVKEKIANIEKGAYKNARKEIINDADCKADGYTENTITKEDIEAVARDNLKKNDHYWKLVNKLNKQEKTNGKE